MLIEYYNCYSAYYASITKPSNWSRKTNKQTKKKTKLGTRSE